MTRETHPPTRLFYNINNKLTIEFINKYKQKKRKMLTFSSKAAKLIKKPLLTLVGRG